MKKNLFFSKKVHMGGGGGIGGCGKKYKINNL